MEERDKNELISVLVTSAEIPEREGSISPSSFNGELPIY